MAVGTVDATAIRVQIKGLRQERAQVEASMKRLFAKGKADLAREKQERIRVIDCQISELEEQLPEDKITDSQINEGNELVGDKPTGSGSKRDKDKMHRVPRF